MVSVVDLPSLVEHKVLALEAFENDYLVFSLFALTVYEHAINIPSEISSIWAQRRTPFTLLLLLLKYITMGYSLLSVVSLFTTTEEKCIAMYRSAEIFRVLLLLGFDACSTLRVWTLSRSPWLIVLVVFLGAVPVGTHLRMLIHPAPASKLALVTGRVRLIRTPSGAHKYGEAPAKYTASTMTNRLWPLDANLEMVIISRLSSILMDAVVLAVTLKHTLPSYRDAARASIRLPITRALLDDGKLYFLAALVANVLELILSMAVPHMSATPFVCVITSITLLRFFLDLRTTSFNVTSSFSAHSLHTITVHSEVHDIEAAPED